MAAGISASIWRRRQVVIVVDVAVRASNSRVRPGQRKVCWRPGVIKGRADPAVKRVTHLAVLRKLAGHVIRIGGLLEIRPVTGNAGGGQPLELAHGRTLVAVLTLNRFPLLGAHAAVPCEDCHKGAAVGQFKGLSPACVSCHRADFQKTTPPKHVTSQFPQNGQMCHTFDSWIGATFNHAGPPANFPLTGAHATIACATCHINNNYNLTTPPNACGNSGCHLTTWQQTTNPKHSAAPTVFPVANCSTCHITTTWTTATFDHSTTHFPLTNSHQLAPAGKVTACTDCHKNNNYNLTTPPNACGNSGCHLTTWQQT